MGTARPPPPHQCRNPGERINYIRSERKWSWAEIDRRAEVTPGHTRTIYVRGSKARTETIGKIARALGVPFEWLAFGTGPAPSRAAIRGVAAEAEAEAPPAEPTAAA